MTRMTGWLAAAVLAVAWPGIAGAQGDDPRTVPLFNAQHTAADILAAAKAKDKALVLVLDGGASYAGKVKDVGDYAVILTELRGKEFFDAWIPLDAIVAMEERVRLR